MVKCMPSMPKMAVTHSGRPPRVVLSTPLQLYTVETGNGKVDWTGVTGGPITSSPATAHGVVYITSADHNIYAFSQNTAHQYWRKPTGSHVKSSPAVANGLVYLGSDDGKLY